MKKFLEVLWLLRERGWKVTLKTDCYLTLTIKGASFRGGGSFERSYSQATMLDKDGWETVADDLRKGLKGPVFVIAEVRTAAYQP